MKTPLFLCLNLWDTINILEGFESLKLTTPIPSGHSLTHAHYAVWHVRRLRRIATSVGSGPASGWYPKCVERSILFISFRVEVALVYFTVARRILCSSWFSSCIFEGEVGVRVSIPLLWISIKMLSSRPLFRLWMFTLVAIYLYRQTQHTWNFTTSFYSKKNWFRV